MDAKSSKRFIAIGVPILLTGCAAVMDPAGLMAPNRYVEVQPSTPSDDVVGKWTGAAGPYIVTIEIGKDGRGQYCTTWHTRQAHTGLKYREGVLHFQDGQQMRVERDGRNLLGHYSQPGMDPIRFVSDPNLLEASPYCKKAVG